MIIVDECVLAARRSPIATPYHRVMSCQIAKHREIAFPRWLSTDVLHEIASKPVVMNADLLQLCRSLSKKRQLPLLASVSLEYHKLQAVRRRICNDRSHQTAGFRLQQCSIVDPLGAVKSGILLDRIRIKISHGCRSPETPPEFNHLPTCMATSINL